jgi:hypothetical protein
VKGIAAVATSRNSNFLVCYVEAFIGRLEIGLRACRNDINVSKNAAVLFVKAARSIRKFT